MNIRISLLYIFILCFHDFLLADDIKLSYKKKPVVISLGHDCGVALQLRRNNLRKLAFPFDWITTLNFSDLYKIIDENFANFLVKPNLSYYNIYIRDSYYNISFFHDFPITTKPGQILGDEATMGHIVNNWHAYIDQVKEKYNRRIMRFNNILNSNKKVIFFRTYAINPVHAKNFVNLIKSKYPKLKFLLVAIHDKPELNYNWQIDNVVSFYFTQRDPNNGNIRWLDSEWQIAFKRLGLI